MSPTIRPLLVLALLTGCGAAASASPSPEAPRASAPSVTLRLHVEPGARYETQMRGRTEAGGAPVLTESRSETVVDHFDPVTRVVRLSTRIGVIELRDASGARVAAPASLDLSGITFLRSLDERRQLIGDVTVVGTTEANAAMAETMRAALRAGLTKLPEAPLAVGDHWTDATSTEVPLGPTVATFVCRIDSVLVAIEGSGDAQRARISSSGTCSADTIALPSESGNGSMTIEGSVSGTSDVLVADGLSGASQTATDTRFTTSLAGQPPRVMEMHQLVETMTARVDP